MKILMVENEECFLEVLSYILRQKGYKVDQAVNADRGLSMAVKCGYDVLIVDYFLPKRDGMSFLQEFRSFNLDTPVVFLTAEDDSEDFVETLDVGTNDYIVNPFSVNELLVLLRVLVLTCREKQNLLNEIIGISWLNIRAFIESGKQRLRNILMTVK
jgi:DNA-binding response OmpR family regulator